MKRFLIVPGLAALAVCLVTVSCEGLEFFFEPIPGRGKPRALYLEEGGGRNADGLPHDDGKKAVYVTGVEYPAGYDWRTDSLYVVVNASIVLYKNSVKTLSIPAGTSEQVSPDADMHHFLDGDLYTEYSDMYSTTVKKNGVRLFAYEGREVLKGLVADGGDVYTLGMNRSGKGFSFRCNGDLLFIRADGEVLGDLSDPAYGPGGALYYDCGELCFSYRGSWDSEWFMYAGGTEAGVEIPPYIDKVYDIRRCGGNVYIIGASGSQRPVITGGGYRMDYSFFVGTGVRDESFRIIPESGGPLFYGTYKDGSGRWKTTVWDFYGAIHSNSGYRNHYFDWASDDVYLSFDDAYHICLNAPGVQSIDLSEPYYYFSYRCVSFDDGRIRMALTPRDTGCPVVWTAEGCSEYGFNGFLTSVSVR